MTLGGVWDELEALAAPGTVGRFKRRVRPECALDLFVGVAKPANQRLLMMLASEASIIFFTASSPPMAVGWRRR